MSLGDFTFSCPNPSRMELDVRFGLDDTPLAPVRVGVGVRRVATLVTNLAGGSHRLSVEVRSVLIDGPPSPTTLSGSPTLKAAALPALPRVLTLNQVLAHTGTTTGGAQGAYVAVDGSESVFSWGGGALELSLGDFSFSYSSGLTIMLLDVRFVLDGTPLPAVRVDTKVTRVATPVASLASGSHTLSIEVRSVVVLGPGPPISTTLSGSPTLKAVAQ